MRLIHKSIIGLAATGMVAVAGISLFNNSNFNPSINQEPIAENSNQLPAPVPKNQEYSEVAKKLAPRLSKADLYKRLISIDENPKDKKVIDAVSRKVADTQDLLTSFKQPNSDTTSNRQLVEATQAEFQLLQAETKSMLEARHQQVSQLNDPELISNSSKLIESVDQRFTSIYNLLGQINNSSTDEWNQSIAQADQYLTTLVPPSQEPSAPDLDKPIFPEPPIENSNDAPPPPPAEGFSIDSYDSSPDSQLQSKTQLQGSNKSWFPELISSAHATPKAVNTCNASPNDVTQALPEVAFTPEIRALAKELDYSPIKIYEYVSNNIEFQPYYKGSLKGALATLKSEAGNATDQSTLLITLLRASGYPARFVRGAIYYHPNEHNRLFNWFKVKNLKAFEAVIGYSTSFSRIYRPSMWVGFRHVWVETCVPYNNHRGDSEEGATYAWIPLDPSYEQNEYIKGQSLPDNFKFDYNKYYSTRTKVLPHEALRNQISNQTWASDNPIGYRWKKKTIEYDILPSNIPHFVYWFERWKPHSSEYRWQDRVAGTYTSALPDAMRHKLHVKITRPGGSTVLADTAISIPHNIDKRITLSFDGTNASARNVINNWKSKGGSLPCGIRVDPVIKVGGKVHARGNSSVDICTTGLQLDKWITVRSLSSAGQPTDPVTITKAWTRAIDAHNYHALVHYSYQVPKDLLSSRYERLLNSIGDFDNPNTHQDDTLGEFLYLAGMRYLEQVTQAYKEISSVYDVYPLTGLHLGLDSTKMRLDYLFDLPFGISTDGFLMDVGGVALRPKDMDDGSNHWDSKLLAANIASAYEHDIWQEMGAVDAISTVRGLQYIHEKNLPELIFGPNDQMPSDVSAEIADTIAAYRKKGLKYFRAPRKPFNYGNWRGYVILATAPSSQRWAMAIAGGYNGGYTTSPPVTNQVNESTNTGTVNATESTDAPLANGTGTGTTNSSVFAGDPVNLVSGNLYHNEKDLHIKGRGGLDLVFERHYNSDLSDVDGAMGRGWTHSFDHKLLFNDADKDQSVENTDNDNQTSSVTWIDGYGTLRHFKNISLDSNNHVAKGKPFTASEGIYKTVERLANGQYQVREKNGFTYTFESVNGSVGQTAKLISLQKRNGSKLTLSYQNGKLNTVSDALGRKLSFTHANGKIIKISDWSGRAYQYEYSNNQLVKVIDPIAQTKGKKPYLYEYYTNTDSRYLEGLMKRFTDSRGASMTFEYYTNGQVYRHTNELGQSYTFTYNPFRRETVSTNEAGETESHIFNKWGLPIQITYPDGTRERYAYDDKNHPRLQTSKWDIRGYQTRYTYNTVGNLTQVIHPSGNKTIYSGYNGLNLPRVIRDPRGHYTLLRYDASGNVTDKIALKAGRTPQNNPDFKPRPDQVLQWTINTYDENSNLVRSTRAEDYETRAGPYTEYVYDSNKLNIVTLRRCDDRNNDGKIENSSECDEATQAYDKLGRATRSIDENWYSRDIKYDALGRISQATDSVGQIRKYQYDANNNLVGETLFGKLDDGSVGFIDSKGMTYDVLNRLVQNTNSAGHSTRFEHDPVGRITKAIDPDGYFAKFEYDKRGRTTKVYDQAGYAITTVYDSVGRKISETQPGGETTRFEYFGTEKNGRVRKVIFPDGTFTEYNYDPNGNVLSQTSNSGQQTLMTYDALNRLVREVGPIHSDLDGKRIRQVSRTEYNALGYITALKQGYTTNVNGASGADVMTTRMTIKSDGFGRTLSKTNASGKTWHYKYDKHNNLIKTIDPKGQIVENTHAYGGLLTEQTLKKGRTDFSPEVISYEHNALGLVTRVNQSGAGYQYRYNKAHQLVEQIDLRADKRLQYDYSPGGTLNHVVDSEGKRVDFLYDGAKRLIALQAQGNQRVNFNYDDGGRLREKKIPWNSHTHYKYDNAGRTTELLNKTGSGTVSHHKYSYDINGNIAKIQQDINGKPHNYTYTYDNLDRLTNATSTTDSKLTEVYRYDYRNNRRYKTSNGKTEYYEYDELDRLVKIRENNANGSVIASYSYDELGNLTEKTIGNETYKFSYDTRSQLIQAFKVGGFVEHYAYDHQGRRIEKNHNGSLTRYHYSGDSVWSEYGSNWTKPSAIYTYSGLDEAIIKTGGEGTRYFHHDALGSVVGVTEQSNKVVSANRYDAWGQVVRREGSPSRFGYIGREQDATGLGYLRARYYDASIGRFTQADPAGFIDGYNRYVYAVNNPLRWSDPFGLSVQSGPTQFMRSLLGSYYDVSVATGQLLIAAVPMSDGAILAINGDFKGALVSWSAEGAVSLATGGTGQAAIRGVRIASAGKKVIDAILNLSRRNCCFVAGTLVVTKNGEKPIEDVQLGEEVLAKNVDTGDQAWKPVTRLFVEHRQIYTLIVKAKNGTEKSIETTDDHPFYVPDKGWVKTLDLEEKDGIETLKLGLVSVLSVKASNRAETTYNLEVADYNSYYATELGLLVHNCDIATKRTTQSGIGVTRHSVQQKINRQVRSADELDAIKNPLDVRPVKIDKLGRPSQRSIGRKAEVARNPETGDIVSVNPTSTKKAERLLRRQGGQ